MKKNLLYVSLLLTVFFVSCKKDKEVIAPGQTPIPAPVLDDTATILLKDIVSARLPSPYYHFVYDPNKYVTQVSFASSLDVYSFQYENKRVKQMLNTKNNNRMQYDYTNNKVSLITEFSGITGEKLWEYIFDYSSNHQLTRIQWFRLSNNATVRIPYRKLILAYYADGNIKTTDDFSADNNGQLSWSTNTLYKDYDSKANVDGFSIFKGFFETLLYLPSIKIQKNNPATVIITGAQNDYKITYTYQYNDKGPILKSGKMIQTRGGNSGQVVNLSSSFSYY